ncbi:MAG: hypothetical protein V5A44_10750 [Haloarculaceae archaeon]
MYDSHWNDRTTPGVAAMDVTKVLVGAFVVVSSLFGLVFVGGTFLFAFPGDPLRLGSALLAESDVPLAVVVVVGAGLVLGAVAPVLLGLGFVVKGALD